MNRVLSKILHRVRVAMSCDVDTITHILSSSRINYQVLVSQLSYTPLTPFWRLCLRGFPIGSMGFAPIATFPSSPVHLSNSLHSLNCRDLNSEPRYRHSEGYLFRVHFQELRDAPPVETKFLLEEIPTWVHYSDHFKWNRGTPRSSQ